jgi:hypothetical protein
MALRSKQRKGIGTVITTLIILIASVVLGAAVIFFGGSIFEANAENDGIKTSNGHIWVATNGTSSVASLVVQNTGDTVVSLSSITVRGMAVPTSSIYFNTVDATATNIQRELTSDFSLTSVDVTGSAPEETFTHAVNQISLSQGQAVIIYIADPGQVTALDMNQEFTVNVQAGGATVTLSGVDVVLT